MKAMKEETLYSCPEGVCTFSLRRSRPQGTMNLLGDLCASREDACDERARYPI